MEVPTHCGGAKRPNNVTSTFFNSVHLLQKDLRFEHGDTKLASCPGANLVTPVAIDCIALNY